MSLRRKLIAALPCLLLTFVSTALPYTVKIHGGSPTFGPQMAEAKGGNGNGGGNGGNGGGNGNGGGSGNGGGNSGNGGGNGNGNGKGNDKGQSSSAKSATQSQVDADQSTDAGNGSITVRHQDGMSEKIQSGRYVMQDSKGRTIVNRTATVSDEQRLKSFLH